MREPLPLRCVWWLPLLSLTGLRILPCLSGGARLPSPRLLQEEVAEQVEEEEEGVRRNTTRNGSKQQAKQWRGGAARAGRDGRSSKRGLEVADAAAFFFSSFSLARS